jgi:amino acid adenylation domain-containing protein
VSAPKNNLPTDLRAQIAERKADILALLRQRSLTQGIAAPSIKRRARSEPAPLSFAQERLWFLEQLEPESSVYNICRASRLLGNLNTSALEASLNEIISRHETLRTAFRLVDGRPVQVVQPIQNISIEYVDLRAIPDNERDAEIQRRIKADLDCAFDLSAEFLLRSTLLRAGDQEHVLILMTHHAASDAWSMGILIRELWRLYQAFSNGNPSQLEPLPVQYSDYAVWQRDWLQGEVLKAQLLYWKEHLKNLPILNLPTDRPRKPRHSFHGARVTITLPDDLTSALNEMSYRHGVTPFMTLLAAFQVLLYRYTGQEDVVVGSPVANRRRPELEGLIGFFVNSLVLRGNLSGNPSFRNLLLRTRDLCIAAGTNQDLPFEKLVQELQPERDQSRNPLFQVMFVLQNATRPFTGIPSLRIEPMEVTITRSPFDLSLFLREREGKYTGHIEYSTDLFNRDRIDRMASHFQTLLEAIVADPDQPITTLPILTEAERRQMLIEWNDTVADHPKNKCIHQLFEEQVERTPEAIAVKFEDQQITYRELNQRANQLAHQLMTLGIGPEKLVGVCIERSIEMVVGLLGILKAGGAYVPLDPAYPDVRLRFMVEDSQAFVLLTTEATIESRRSRMENGHSLFATLDPRLQIVSLDRDSVMVSQRNDKIAKSEVKSSNLAYIIYTSGSTGQPKGVAIEHRNAVNLLHWAKSVYKPTDLAGVLASTSICFDLSVFELFVPLSSGGKVILVENALSLRERKDRGITLVNTVPSLMGQVLALDRLPESIQVVNLAGEPLKSELVNHIYEQPGVQRVYDLYGPSETTTYSTFTLRQANGPETIGHPVANTQIYILDGSLQPVPVGVTGEIFIGGAGVARGYLNRSDLTAEMFIADPFREGQRSQLYRTGDHGRYLSDGDIEYLGRMDNQVKVRGYRIEPGEIEAILTELSTVKDCVVATCEHQSRSGKNLVAYVVPTEQNVLSDSELRRDLKEKLPEYMIPSYFVVLDAFPLSPNGKVDRNSLPPPDGTRSSVAREFASPRSEIEELIAQTWRGALQIENVGIHDNFFELGGHSLLAAQIVAALEEIFGKAVPVGVLFDAPTIAELAQKLEKIIRDGHAPELPAIVPVPRDGPLPLSMNQEHLWRLDQMIPGTHFFNMPYVYRLSGDLNIDALKKALGEIIKRHESLRTVFTKVYGQPRQVIKQTVRMNIPLSDLRKIAPENRSERAAKLVISERTKAFNLATGPLVRFKLARLTDTSSLLLVTMHHIVSDHWSMQIFRSELELLYEAFSNGRLSPLPQPQIQFADFAIWERSAVNHGLFQRQLAYWTDRLSGASPQPLTWQEIKPKKPSRFQRSREPIEIDENGLSQLKGIARREAATVFMVVVTALGVFLHLRTNNTNIRIGTLVANRRRETETTIGHFLNTVVLCLSIERNMTCRQLLRQVRQTTLSAFRHQELPYERLAQVLKEKHVDRAATSQVLLSYQMARFDSLEGPGLKIAPLIWQQPASDSELTPTTFDMIFTLREAPAKLVGSVNYWSGIPRCTLSPLNGFLNSTLRQMDTDLETRISTVMP